MTSWFKIPPDQVASHIKVSLLQVQTSSQFAAPSSPGAQQGGCWSLHSIIPSSDSTQQHAQEFDIIIFVAGSRPTFVLLLQSTDRRRRSTSYCEDGQLQIQLPAVLGGPGGRIGGGLSLGCGLGLGSRLPGLDGSSQSPVRCQAGSRVAAIDNNFVGLFTTTSTTGFIICLLLHHSGAKGIRCQVPQSKGRCQIHPQRQHWPAICHLLRSWHLYVSIPIQLTTCLPNPCNFVLNVFQFNFPNNCHSRVPANSSSKLLFQVPIHCKIAWWLVCWWFLEGLG